MKAGRNDPCPCGSGKKFKKCCHTKVAAHSTVQLRQTEIGGSGRSARRSEPTPADQNELLDLFNAGRYTELESQALLLVERHPESGVVWKALGISLCRQGKDGLSYLQRATALSPDDANAHINLGNAQHEVEQLDAAVASYRRTLELEPDYADAHNNLGVALQDLERLDEAVASYHRALALKPDHAGAHNNLGRVFQELGRIEAARICYQKAYELGLDGARVRAAMMLPPIMGTRQEVLRSRAAFERNVDQLLDEPIHFDNPLKQLRIVNFYLAYHGFNDRDLQVKIAKFYERSCPSLLYVAPHCAKPRPANRGKIRVGFLSRFIYTHSVSRCFSRIIEELARRDSFEVILISSHGIDYRDSRSVYSAFAGECIHLPDHLAKAREQVATLELDILVYLDIGMEPLSYLMAFSRLARAQCVMGGHPVTTGIRNMDYFLSTDLTEADDADEHYSETLIRFPIGIFYFERPALPATFKTRSELGLPEDRHIYMCPMKLQKMHPDFDEALTRILQIDADGVVILFDDEKNRSWKGLLTDRLDKTMPKDVRERILFLPWIDDYADFLSANAAADVVLDPFHFGIGSTVIATFAVGTPIVTKPGKFLRGRVGMGFCRMMDLEECVAEDTETYAQKAVHIADNKALRNAISAKMLANNHVLYDNLQPINDLVDFLCSVATRRPVPDLYPESGLDT